ncbi:MAG: hypothetical protein HPY45_00500 [Anaerolineae bacterium]|nr:hypothetical protein [Anaerolineae bacterium]
MFEDLRESAASAPFLEEETPPPAKKRKERPKRSSSSHEFLGMSPVQRFVIALMLLMMVCALGAFCLIISGKMVPPFL